MGGNAIIALGHQALRISLEESKQIAIPARDKLVAAGIFEWLGEVRSHRGKKDHGDIDLIGPLTQGQSQETWPEQAALALGLGPSLGPEKKMSRNGFVLSLAIPHPDRNKGKEGSIQLDLTARKTPTQAKAHLDFSHYSPLGNILGRTIRCLNPEGAKCLKWGIDGLEFQIRSAQNNEDALLGTVGLSTNLEEIFELIELDPETWKNGFEDEQAIFRFAREARGFRAEDFKLENLNHVHRKRNRTRPDYHAWIEFLEKTAPPDKAGRWLSVQEMVGELETKFPSCGLKEKVGKAHEREKSLLAARNKFNGSKVQKWAASQGIELAGTTLGEAIKTMREDLGIQSPKSFEDWLLSPDTTEESAKSLFLKSLRNAQKGRKVEEKTAGPEPEV
jgi:hypothetical protein